MHRGLTRLARAAILPALVLCGCATVAPVNVPVDRVEPETGYRIAKLLGRHRGPTNNPDALVFLACSGGGTRAAALSYGVLEELRRTPIMVKGHQHSMLDEVDLVAGVSGGSFTALAYALYGERLFDEYQDRFLKRNVQGELIQRILNPANWPRLARDGYGRSELAADYYDEILFAGATFSDLISLDAPVVVVTGTDLSRGAGFEFSQDTFDLLCSDRGSVRLNRAAATSSAVPKITFDAIDVSFEAIEDPSERREFMEMQTTFFLPRNPSTGCVIWVAGSCATRAPTRFCSSALRSSRSSTRRRP